MVFLSILRQKAIIEVWALRAKNGFDSLSTIRTVKSSNGSREIRTHAIEKNDSLQLSKFQALGYLLRWVDALCEDPADH
ncbi:hypothetical protein JFT44_11585 [Pseudomonas sp. MF5691]|uniref:hypothetical protein n=1 Tax=Pseudomonas sp. MF5691 TaxID=2797526 RepID=UPI0018E6FEB4|nr:hypothetical protein [Pseudomonas sp. MF5691]MBJ2290574.1 hypothetical protein [Pseudomonas sp. MF5691]